MYDISQVPGVLTRPNEPDLSSNTFRYNAAWSRSFIVDIIQKLKHIYVNLRERHDNLVQENANTLPEDSAYGIRSEFGQARDCCRCSKCPSSRKLTPSSSGRILVMTRVVALKRNECKTWSARECKTNVALTSESSVCAERQFYEKTIKVVAWSTLTKLDNMKDKREGASNLCPSRGML